MQNRVIKLDIDYNQTFKDGFDIDRVDLSRLGAAARDAVDSFRLSGQTGGIYGASTSGKALFMALEQEGFDSFFDVSLNGCDFCGLPSVHPHEARWPEFVLIAVSPSNYLSVLKTLSKCIPSSVALIFPWKFEFFDPQVWMENFSSLEQEPSDQGYLRTTLARNTGDLRGNIVFDGDRVFRNIREQDYQFYRALVRDQAQMSKLCDNGLIKTWVVEDSPETGLRLEHKAVLRHSFRNWTMGQFRQAALFFLDWWAFLTSEGYSLQDCHCANVMFDNSEPVFVDFCSVGPREATTISPPFMWEFINSWIAPLSLIKDNQHQIYREALENKFGWARSKPLCSREIADEVDDLVARGESLLAERDVVGFIQAMRGWVDSVTYAPSTYGWNNGRYQTVSLSEEQPQTDKERIVAGLFDRFALSSFLDLGCNSGRYSMFALHRGMEVVALDSAESLIEELHQYSRDGKKPLSSLYWKVNELSGFCQPEKKFDMVAYLALVHHLVFSAGMRVEDVVRQADALCRNVLLFEYIAPVENEPFVLHNYRPEKHGSYSPEGFAKLLGDHFDTVEEIETSPSRILFVASR